MSVVEKLKEYVENKQVTAYEKLDRAKIWALDIIKNFEDNNIDWTLNQFEDKFLNKKTKVKILDFWNDLINDLENKKRFGNATVYQKALGRVLEFDPKFNKKYFVDIDLRYLNQFNNFLIDNKNKGNTRSIYLKTFRAVFNAAILMKVASKEDYPFGRGGFNIGALNEETQKRYLPNDFLEILKNSNFEDETENFVKNIFMLQYYLHGISFVDLSHLKNENVVKQNDGDYIVFKRIKLMNNPKAKFQQIKLTEEIKRILSALIEHQKPVENYLIPIVVKSGLPYDKLYLHIKNKCNLINLKLKEISKKLGFDNFNLTTYVSRHTVAMKLRESNVPIEVIQQVFGHSAISTTQIYLDSFGTEAINKAVENL